MSNSAKEFTSDIVSSLLVNISTISTHSLSLQAWTDQIRSLNDSWQTGGDPAIQQKIDEIGKLDPSKSAAQIIQEIKDLITSSMSPGELRKWSMGLVASLLTKLGRITDDKQQQAVGTATSMITQFNQLISAQATSETSAGDSEIKAVASVVQQDGSAQQPLADAGNAVSSSRAAVASELDKSF